MHYKTMNEHSDGSDEYESQEYNKDEILPKKSTRAKSSRSRASWQQRTLLERVFQHNQYPDQNERAQLAKELGMSVRKVQVWFQNRRTKAKQSPEMDPTSSFAEIQDVNFRDGQTGNSFLFIASAAGSDAVVQLLARGSDSNLANKNNVTPLYIAVMNGQSKSVDTLLTKRFNCNPNVADNIYGQTPLHIASLKGFDTISLILLSKGTNIIVNATDFEGRTPLHHACVYGHVRIVRQLINCKANINMGAKDGITPLHVAAFGGHVNVVGLLIDHGADVNAIDYAGFTPLYFATLRKHEDCVQILKRKGAVMKQTV